MKKIVIVLMFAVFALVALSGYTGPGKELKEGDSMDPATVCSGTERMGTIPLLKLDDYDNLALILCEPLNKQKCKTGYMMCVKGVYQCACKP